MKGSQKMRILKMLSLVLVFALALGIGVTATMQHGGNKSANVVSLDTQTALGGASASGGKIINNADDSGKQLIEQKENVISSPITQAKLPPLLKTDVETGSSAPAFSPNLLTNAVLSFARYAGTRVFMLTSAVVSGSDAVPVDGTQPTDAPTEDAAAEKVSASDTSDKNIIASDAAGEEGLLDGSSEPEEFLAEGDTYVSFTVTQSYNDSVEDKPTSYGQITLETYGSKITPEDATSAVQQYITTSASSGGTIASGAQMSNLKILSYDRKYPISNVQVFVNGADVTSEIGSFTNKTTDSYGKSYWIYTFSSGFGFADGSDVVFKIEYGSWEKYTLSQRYSDTIPESSRPSTYGKIYVLSSKGILCDDTTTTNNVTLTSDEQTEIGYIEPNLQINYIEVTPPNSPYYYVDSVKILVDGVDVTDTAIASTNVSSAGVWKLTFKTDYVISAGSTLQVEAVYDGWKTYTLKQDYDSSVNPKPETFGTVTLNGAKSFLPDGFTTLQNSASIITTEQSETGIIQPNAALTFLYISTPSFHSVREVNVYLNGVCVNDEAFNYSDSRTSTPSSGNWTIYFNSGYKVPAGTTLELEVKYGGWQTYELRQDYQDSVTPKPETFGTVALYGTTSFLPEGFNTLQSNIGITPTEQSEIGIIQPETRPTFVQVTPPANYSVREIHAYLDGELVDETAFNYSHSSNTMGSTGNWKIYFNSGFKVPDGSTFKVEAKYGGWQTYELRQDYQDSIDPKPKTYGTVTVYGTSSFLPEGFNTLQSNINITPTEQSETGLIQPEAHPTYINVTPPTNYSVREIHVYLDGELVDDTALNYDNSSNIIGSYGNWKIYFSSGFKVPDGSTFKVEAKYGGWQTYELRQDYQDSIDPKPETYGTITVYGTSSFLPEGFNTLQSNINITPTEQSETGLIKPEAHPTYINATPPANYSVRKIHVYIDGELVDDTAFNYEHSSNVMGPSGNWKIYFNNDFIVHDGSTLLVEVEYGDWESYEIRQAYADYITEKPEALGTVTLYGTSSFLPEGFNTLQSTASITPTEQSETGLIKPEAHPTYINATPPTNYSVRKIHVYIDGELVDDTAFNYEHSSNVMGPSGNWKIYFNSDFIVHDGSTLLVEVEYGDWESYEIRQAYADYITEKPDTLGTVTLYGTSSFLPEGFNTLQSTASITPTEQSETGLIKPEAHPTYINATPPTNYSVRKIHVYIDGELVDDTAFNYEHSSNIMGPSGNWKIYFNNDFIVHDGSTLLVEVEYGDWESYEIRQAYADYITEKPEALGTVTLYGTSSFLPEGFNTLQSTASITPTEQSEKGFIKPEAHPTYINVTPPANYSVRKIHVYVDGELVDDTAFNYNNSSNVMGPSGNWKIYFNSDFRVHDGSTLLIEVEYGDWESYEIRQAYADYITEKPDTLGTVTLYGTSSFLPEGFNTLQSTASITPTEQSEKGFIKPEAHPTYINVTPPANYSVRKIHVYVDGELVDDTAFNYNNSSNVMGPSGNWKIYFNNDFIVHDGSTLLVEVEYGNWESYEIRQAYADYITEKPDTLGTVTLYGTSSFLPEGFNTLQSNIGITPTEQSEKGLIKPEAHPTYINVTPPANYSVRKIHVYIDGELVDDTAFNYEHSSNVMGPSGNWKIYFNSDFRVHDGSTLEIEVEYGDWESYEIRQAYADYITEKPDTLGSVTLYGTSSFLPEGFNTLQSNINITPTEQSETGLIKPEAHPTYINVTPPANYSVRKIHVYIDGELVDDTAFNYEHSSNVMGPSGNWKIYFNNDFRVHDSSTLLVEVEYGDWESYKITQQYSDSVDPKPEAYGAVTLYGTSSFLPEGFNTLQSTASISRNESAEEGRIKPDATLTRLDITVPTGYSIVGADIYVDGELQEDAINYSHSGTTTPGTGNWTLYFASNYKIPDGSSLEVIVTYGDWCDFTVTQKYAHSVDPIPSEYGAVNVYGINSGTFFVDDSRLSNSISVSQTESKAVEKLRPDYKLNYITAIPQTNYSVLSIDVYVDGTLLEDAIDLTRIGTLNSSTGMWRLYFDPDFSVSTGSEVEVVVTYGDWFDITLSQENLLNDTLGKMSVKSDRYNGFVSGSTYSRNFEISSAESGTKLVHPDATVSDLTVTPPTGLSILEATATVTKDNITTEWLVDGKSAVKLNDDGTVSLNAAQPDGDIVISVKYGARLYIRSNIADVVTVDSVAATTEFAKLSDIESSSVTLDILAKDGWKITSVSYGTNGTTQNTVILGSNNEYSISSIASDIYVNINVERADRKLSARLDGTGEASIVYGKNTTELTGTAQVIDDAVQIGSEVTFEVTAGTDTEILDVTLNGKSLGSIRKFTMPDTDSEIVVYTELKITKLMKIEAVLTGDGEAEASYSDTVVTLEKTARAIAADIKSGTYDITFSPLEGSEIISVSIGGTKLTPKGGSGDVYSITVADEDVLVTVETRKIPSYSIYAKANIADAAKFGDTALTTDYEIVATEYENGNVSLELIAESGYEVVEVKGGDKADSLTAIEPTDGKYTFDNLSCDKYVEVTLAKQPTITVKRTGDGVVYTAGVNADISNTSYLVKYGSDHNFSFIPLEGAELVKVTVTRGENDPVVVYDPANGIRLTRSVRSLDESKRFDYTLGSVTEDCVIEAVFTNQPEFEMHVIKTGEGEGTFDYDKTVYTDSFDTTVTYGSEPSITIKAKAGSKIVSVKVGDSEETAEKIDFSGSKLTLPKVTKDVYVEVEFEKLPPSGDTPKTGDTIATVTINLFVISGLVCAVYMINRRKEFNKA